ncbi:MAG: hypothetical protein KFF77_05855 [Bacteroidetes bacterium]|nr:hypothetical protein [Bacteroidota bacterium]
MKSISNIRAFLGVTMAITALAVSPLDAQWRRVESLAGIQVGDFEVTRQGVLCVVPWPDDGFYVSTTGGKSWVHRSENGMPLGPGVVPSVHEIECSDHDLFFLSYNKVYRVRDFSSALELIPPPRDGKVGTFAVSAEGTLFATLVDNPLTDSVYRSTDFGGSWESICGKYANTRMGNALLLDSTGGLWSHDPWSIARYDETSGSWIRHEGIGFEETNRRRFFPLANGDVYVNLDNRIVKYTAATASVMTLFTSNVTVRPGLEFWRCGDGVLLVCDRSIDDDDWLLLRSTDEGETWSIAQTRLPNEIGFLGEHAGTVYGTFGADIVATDDHGHTLQDRTQGLFSTDIKHFETRHHRVHVMAMRYAMSDDGGLQWRYPGYGGGGGNALDLQVTSDGTMYENREKFRVSRDSSRTWEFTLLWDLTDMLARDDVVLIATHDGEMLRSLDGGRSWAVVLREESLMFELTEHHGQIFAIKKGRLLHSSDRGATWVKRAFPPSVTTDGVTLGVNDRVVLIAGMGFLWSSSDHGESWTEIRLDPLNGRFRRLVSNSDGTFAAVYLKNHSGNQISQVAMLSIDDGVTWTSISDGLPRPFTYPYYSQISDIGFTADHRLLMNVQGRGLYEYTDIPVHVQRAAEGNATLAVSLFPTITSELLHLSVLTHEAVHGSIVNTAGQRVAKFRIDAGMNGMTLDVHALPVGRYVLHVATSTSRAVKSFLVTK